jgi:histidyl-tRNA synthetase
MFRAERPQAGRMRQFHQIGAEAIGSLDPALDAECIALAAKVLDACGVKDYRIRLNNLGCAEDKKRLSKTLKEALSEKKALLCGDCKARLKANPLRTLDCKQDSCKDVIRAAVKSVRFLCEGCARHFDGVTRHLDILKVPYSLDPYIVRGLDYYTRTVFEASHATLGKGQDAIGAGGRYDNLISDMGGPSLGATGFALGVERMLIAAGASFGAPDEARDRGVYIAAIGAGAHEKGFEITNDLRSKGIACDMDYEGKSLKAQMRSADKSGAKFVVIIGDEELKSGEATLRDMRTKEQSKVKLETLAERIRGK